MPPEGRRDETRRDIYPQMIVCTFKQGREKSRVYWHMRAEIHYLYWIYLIIKSKIV